LNIACSEGVSAFQIFNARGQCISNVQETGQANAWQIEVSSWAKGWYVLENVRGESQHFMVE
jgi:hypothetical protein